MDSMEVYKWDLDNLTSLVAKTHLKTEDQLVDRNFTTKTFAIRLFENDHKAYSLLTYDICLVSPVGVGALFGRKYLNRWG